jgi:hypothetical protein
MTASTFKVNGVALLIQPSDTQWLPRKELGVDGFNRKIYEPVYSYQLSFDVLSQAQFYQLLAFWQLMATQTTVTADLPDKTASTYTFKTYTGCTVDEPQVGAYFQNNQLSIKVTIRNITV